MSMSIRTRLTVAFGVVLTLLTTVGVLSWWNTRKLSDQARGLYEDQLEGVPDDNGPPKRMPPPTAYTLTEYHLPASTRTRRADVDEFRPIESTVRDAHQTQGEAR